MPSDLHAALALTVTLAAILGAVAGFVWSAIRLTFAAVGFAAPEPSPAVEGSYPKEHLPAEIQRLVLAAERRGERVLYADTDSLFVDSLRAAQAEPPPLTLPRVLRGEGRPKRR